MSIDIELECDKADIESRGYYKVLVTLKNINVREVIEEIGIEELLFEMSSNDILEYIGKEECLEYFGIDEVILKIIKNVPTENMTNLLADNDQDVRDISIEEMNNRK